MAILSRGQITLVNMGDMMDLIDQHIAYAWSQDGTDRFMRKWSENLLVGDVIFGNVYDSNGEVFNGNQPYLYRTDKFIPVKSGQTYNLRVYNRLSSSSYDRIEKILQYSDSGVYISSITNLYSRDYSYTVPSGVGKIKVVYQLSEDGINTFINNPKKDKGLKIEIGERTIYTPSPDDDYDNAVPRYIGRSLKDSNDPADFTWEPNPERKPWTAYVQGVNGEGLSLMPYGENLALLSDMNNSFTSRGVTATLDRTSSIWKVSGTTNAVGDLWGFRPGSKDYNGPGKYIYSLEILSGTFPVGICLQASVYKDGTWSANYKNESGNPIMRMVHFSANFRDLGMYSLVAGTVVNFTARVKLELANTMNIPTPWTPAPSEDPLGAIPKYVGTAALPYEDWTKYAYTMNPEWADLNATLGLNTKVDNGQYQEDKSQIFEDIANRVTKEEAAETNRIARKALDMITAYTDPDSGKAAADLKSLEQRIVGMVNELGAKIARWNFIDTWMTAGEEGFSIANAKSTTKFLVKNNRMSFINNGEEVAYFSGQSFMIQRGIVTQGMQIGSHKEEALNKDHTVTRWIAT